MRVAKLFIGIVVLAISSTDVSAHCSKSHYLLVAQFNETHLETEMVEQGEDKEQDVILDQDRIETAKKIADDLHRPEAYGSMQTPTENGLRVINGSFTSIPTTTIVIE